MKSLNLPVLRGGFQVKHVPVMSGENGLELYEALNNMLVFFSHLEFPWIFVLIGCLAVVLVIVLIITAVLLLGR